MAFQPEKQYQEAATHNTADPMTASLAVRRDSDTSAVADGQYEALHTNSTGRLKVSTHNGAFDTVSGTITATAQSVSADVSRAGSAIISITGTYSAVNITFQAYDGVNWVAVYAKQTDALTASTTSGSISSVTRAWNVTPLLGFTQVRVLSTAYTSGTATIRITPSVQAPEVSPVTTIASGTVTTVTTVSTLTGGGVASGAADSGNPHKIGAVARLTNPTAVTDGQRVNLIADKLGKQVVVGSIRDLKVQQTTTITNSTTETTILTAVAATFLDLYGLIITNTSATACTVTIKDATAGTTRFVYAIPANDTRQFIVPESAAHNQAVVNTSWTATCSSAVTSIVITAMAVKNI